MRVRAILAAAVLLGGLVLAGRADDPKKPDAKQPDPKDTKKDDKADAKPADPKGGLSRVELDKRIEKMAFEAADAGTKLYAAGNVEGCFRLYQGALIAIVPLLDHRPRLAAYVRDRLDSAAKLDSVKGAFALREALDAVQKEAHEGTLPPKKALWDRLGGEKPVRAVIKDFLATATKDDKLDPTRGGTYTWDAKALENAENVLVNLVREYTGGPAQPTIPNLRAILPGTNITDAEFTMLQTHLYNAMEKNGIGRDERLEVLQLFRTLRAGIVGQ